MRAIGRVHLTSDLTGPFADDPRFFHGKHDNSGNSNTAVVGLSLFFTCLIIAALILIWYFYKRRNQEMAEQPTAPVSPYQPFGVVPYPPQQLFTAFNNTMPTMPAKGVYPFPVGMPLMVNQEIQTSGNMNPMATANFQVQTSNIPVGAAVQTSNIPFNQPPPPIQAVPQVHPLEGVPITTSTTSIDVPIKPPTPVSAFNTAALRSGQFREFEVIGGQLFERQPIIPTQKTYATEGPDIPLTVSRVLGASGGMHGVSEALVQSAARQPTPIVEPSSQISNDIARQMNAAAAQMQYPPRPMSPLRNSQPLIAPMAGPPPQIPLFMPMPPAPPTSGLRAPPLLPPPMRPTSPPPMRNPLPPPGLQYPTLPPMPKPMTGLLRPISPMPPPFRGF